jgi:hypothetical protein
MVPYFGLWVFMEGEIDLRGRKSEYQISILSVH